MFFLQNDLNNSQTMIVQSVLKKMGFYSGKVNGVYNSNLEEAVRQFQSQSGILADGIVGPVTYKALEKYILGYTYYRIEPNDTLTSIAEKNHSTVNLILSANPNINPNNLIPNTVITVPFNYNVVMDDINYTYKAMWYNIMGLIQRYPFLEASSIGNSVLGNDLFLIKFGDGPKKIHINASHHALEWITSVFVMKFIESISNAYINDEDIEGYSIENIFNTHTFYIVPMVNPDGVDLVTEGLQPNNPYHNDLIMWNKTGRPFSEVWQANIRGVDLNHNYDAAWKESKNAEKALGITGPGPTRYSGEYPFSEPETQAMRDLTQNEDFYLALAYHTQGEIIYWNFMNLATQRDQDIGDVLAKASGYTLDTATGVASYAGYKDWFIKDFRKPGYTVEAGKGKNPLPITQLPRIYEDNMRLILAATTV